MNQKELQELKVPERNLVPFLRFALESAQANPRSADFPNELAMMRDIINALESDPTDALANSALDAMGCRNLGGEDYIDNAAMYGLFCASRGGVE